ncbi:MAG TPA: toll/interleukin-1 receptor domain-containing protein, partial [Puia sp.]|nr:toll/interleukin-1 receptor domain-containing protein [Puia sp.]
LEIAKEEVVVPKNINPLIFISHDTRDAELAEEFSNLLKTSSAGALKSFVSSDKKGTRGIEYGVEWYPAIMDKIDEASEVVCLLTQHSVERPWILYEAGVAKGKLNKKVIGIAMGIQHSVAFTGPFAQFQNNDGSVNAITKLVIDLVKKVPGLDPDHQLVEQLVQTFHNKTNEILAKNHETTQETQEVSNENTVAKLFEEVKIMFESLPSRIENRIDPEFKKRRRKFHPIMIEEMMHMGIRTEEPYVEFLIMISFLKDDLPWMYELGLETYRGLKASKSIAEKRKLASSFERAFEMIGHPMMREFYGKSEDMHMFTKELRHFMHRFLDRFLNDEKLKE